MFQRLFKLGFVLTVAAVAVAGGYALLRVPREWMVMGLVVFGVFSFSFLQWRAGVTTALVLVVIEGALRKWIFPEWQELIYWSKDVALAGAYVRFYGARMIDHKWLVPPHPINKWLAPLILWGLAEALNPNLPGFLVGALGLKAYFFYIPLFYMIPELVEGRAELMRFLGAYAGSSLLLSVLGIAQFFSPLDSPLVSYVAWEGGTGVSRVAMVGDFPRVTATFPFISGYVAYLFAVVLVLLALLNMRDGVSPRRRAVLFAALGLAAVNLFMTGSRWPIFTLLFLIPVFLAMAGDRVSARARLFARAAVGLVVLSVVALSFFGEAVGAFWERAVTNREEAEHRIVDPVTEPFLFLPLAGVIGSGIGATHQAARFVAGTAEPFSWLPTLDFENEPGRIMLELGAVGFVLFYIQKLALLGALWRVRRDLADEDLRLLAAVAFCMHLAFFFWPTVFNVTAALYLWSLSGLLFLLPRLDAEEDLADEAIDRAGARARG
jgi:hypothetical protein